MSRSQMLSLAVALLVSAARVEAERIELRDGQVINAPILHQSSERVVVDLGYEIVAIPRQQIREIRTEDVPAASAGDVQATDDLYSTANMKTRSVKQLAEQFAEGVVLVSTPAGLGSGFFISKEGHLITNFHVVEGETKLSVAIFRKVGGEFRREKIEDVEIVATNPFMDLALLRVNLPPGQAPVLTYLNIEDDLRDGDPVFAIGNPLGLERTVSEGIVSRVNRAEEGLAYIQTTTQINPGNSGGPLFNMRGQIVGVTSAKIMGGEGLGFAIPVRYVVDFLRNREAFAYNSESSESGYRYVQPPSRLKPGAPEFLKTSTTPR